MRTWDAIVVGARCAGSPLAMLLARRGHRVVVCDAARFPSDTVSTHLIWPAGVAALRRWGLWEPIRAADPGICHVGLTTMPGGTLRGPWHAVDDVDYTLNLRRVKLDAILVAAAAAAGAEIREDCVVTGLLRDGERVVGVEGYHRRSSARFSERAAIVVGADGARSTVAGLVGAERFHDVPSLCATYYGYFSGLPGDRDVDEIHTVPPHEYLFSPTDDGLTVVNLVMEQSLAAAFRTNVREHFFAAFDRHGDLGDRLRSATLVGRIRGVLEQPNFYRRSHGCGWALVGDAAYVKDPIRAQGITDALLDAEGLAVALDAVRAGRELEHDALAQHESRRLERTRLAYELCLRAARFDVPPVETTIELLQRISDNPAAIAEMRGLVAGSVRGEVLCQSYFHSPPRLMSAPA